MVEEKKYQGVGDPFKIFLKESLKRQRNAMMDNLPRSFSGYPKATHLLLAATLEPPHPLRYKLTLASPYLKVR